MSTDGAQNQSINPVEQRMAEPQSNESSEAPLTFLEYLDSPNGHQIATQVLGLIKDLQKATIDTSAEQNRRQVEFQQDSWKRGMYVQVAIILAALLSCTFLMWIGKMSDAVGAGLIGTIVGFIFGRRQG